MKLKNKIISIALTLFMVISSFTYSSASTLVAGGVISYELLMGLMGIGVSFGLALPKDDDQYWDYTRSLKKHLQVVDDVYLDKLDKSIKEWKFKNDYKPPSEKEPLKVPYIPILKELFDNVGKDVSTSYQYVSSILEPIPVLGTPLTDLNWKKIDMGDVLTFQTNDLQEIRVSPISIKDSNYSIFSVASPKRSYDYSFYNPDKLDYTYSSIAYEPRTGFYYIYRCNDLTSFSNQNNYPMNADWISVERNKDVKTKESIEYKPTLPDVNKEEIILPSLPSVNIPSFDSLPNFDKLELPFEVTPELPTPDTAPDSGGDSNPDVGGDSNPDVGGDSNPDVGGDSNPDTSFMQSIINLFVPSADYWQNTFDDFFNNVGDAFPMIDIGRFKDLCINGVPPKDIEVTIMGAKGKIFNTKYLNSIIDWLQPIVSAFMAFLLILYNYRKVYKLIRGFEPFSGIADGNSVADVRGKTDGSMPEMGGSSFIGPSAASTWSDGQSVTRGSIQSRYYGRDL